ncbi:MAG TPA: HAD family phosphatase [Rubrivivax sp.]|nr:HAD family phosphatase [Rubrivivax sp.]
MANVVFDFGGVVFRWQPLELLRQVLPQRAPDDATGRRWVSEMFQSFAVGGDWAAFDRGVSDADTVAQQIAARSDLRADEVRAVIDAIPAHLVPIDDTLQLMRAVKQRGHRLFYLSNMPLEFASLLEHQHAFFDWFDDGIFSSRVRLIKPEPAIYLEAMRQFSVAPADTVFIDDVAHNLDAAQALGWQGIRFESAAQCGEALRKLGLI